MPPHPSDPETAEFIVEMSRALAAHGTPAHRLEQAMSVCAARLGVHAEFFATPTAVFASIGEGQHNVTRLVRVESAEVNLDRLTRLDAVLQRVSAGQIDAAQGRIETAAALASPHRWPVTLRVLATGVAAATAARFFGGGWRELALATLAGVAVGLLALVAARVRRLVRVIDFAAGGLVAVVAGLLAPLLGGADADTVVISGLIALIPGLSLTIAVSEIATRNIVAGSARLIAAAATLATIAFGVAAGDAVASAILPSLPVDPATLPAWTEWIALALAPAALLILFNAAPSDLPAVAAVSVCGFLAARYAGEHTGTQLGVGIGAIVVGVLANLRAIRANKPAGVCALPGIMLLVPGAIGFRSLSAFLDQQAVQGLQAAVLAVVIALSLATGLLLANVLLPPNRAI